ncbi:MAG: OB-fold putative lipoprotein [Chitinophagaceae bacterium]|nr:OB-fold putative lipoprotein [Chitinophagaceae bacterium]
MNKENASALPGFIFPALFAAGLMVLFFFPWVQWQGYAIKGVDFPAGRFFRVAESEFRFGNPYPALNISFHIFWLIPVLSAGILLFHFLKKQNLLIGRAAGALSLALACLYYLFTHRLADLGIGGNVFSMIKWPWYILCLCGAGLIITSPLHGGMLKKILWLAAGPLFTLLAFFIIEKKVWTETHDDLQRISADYVLDARDLLQEFLTSDSSANRKYKEKIVAVHGKLSKTEILEDSSVNIQFSDSLGNYLVFSFEKNNFEQLKHLEPGDSVSVKGSCSGSIFSEILGTTSVSFKRSVLNKNDKP